MLQATHDVLTDPVNEFPLNIQEKIIGILNSHHAQLFEDGNLSTSADLYLAGAYLNPSTCALFLCLFISSTENYV
jgi:hypothetical protein